MRSPERAQRLLAALVSGGVREVVLCPGSRSAGLAVALHAADASRDVRLHVRVDERSAGFLALGLAAGSRTPVAVVTTSGTAVGNLLPAVMEAAHSGRRLVLLTADRPAAMRGTGANQTTQQNGIFGVFAPCFDLGVDATAADLDAAAGVATRRRGPTQLNLQLEEPLLPDSEPWWPPTTRPAASHPGAEAVGRRGVRRAGVELLRRGPRTVVVAGDDAGPPRESSPNGPAGRSWPSPRPGLGSAPTPCAPTGCSSAGPASATASNASSCSATRRCRDRRRG